MLEYCQDGMVMCGYGVMVWWWVDGMICWHDAMVGWRGVMTRIRDCMLRGCWVDRMICCDGGVSQ